MNIRVDFVKWLEKSACLEGVVDIAVIEGDTTATTGNCRLNSVDYEAFDTQGRPYNVKPKQAAEFEFDGPPGEYVLRVRVATATEPPEELSCAVRIKKE